MIKAWMPVIEDINSEIARLHSQIADLQFNSDFGHHSQLIKMRIAALTDRLNATTKEMKRDAAARREMIDGAMTQYYQESIQTFKALADLRIFRAERGRANYLHCLELKANEEGGAE